ncbi:hypothetical protein BDV38DRAFT_235614 [Aspergillus pseudotamarii]|uniref:Secreted protein n=1 Tax=Aspergillus pseudotamarii TaxID=132259 RepID=A0A5N6T6Z7_ASPPS|nr:uncharacterized protein BDV38DRAFT_235614 [Aspergillus pseudotamarii]KAE8142057.1 hypothetical protein BDV38DRAFT_235614 [Aspergillus pseudotamarii]
MQSSHLTSIMLSCTTMLVVIRAMNTAYSKLPKGLNLIGRSTAVLGIALRDTVKEPYLTQHARWESNATLIHFVRSLSVIFILSLCTSYS